jgi:hypothetical protein
MVMETSFVEFQDAIYEAHRRADLTRYRYRVRFDRGNHIWLISESTQPVPSNVGQLLRSYNSDRYTHVWSGKAWLPIKASDVMTRRLPVGTKWKSDFGYTYILDGNDWIVDV